MSDRITVEQVQAEVARLKSQGWTREDFALALRQLVDLPEGRYKSMSRADHEGDGPFDSIAWLFETHIKEPDDKEFNYAVVYGNEDSPKKIYLWKSKEPLYQERPDRIWYREELGI